MTAGRGGVLVAHQPAYLPWCGYLSRLTDVAEMVVLDHVQFSERGYQHRNQITDRTGRKIWLTVPVRRRFGQPLTHVQIADGGWARKHWATLTHNYRKAPHWDTYAAALADLYSHPWTRLVDLDLEITRLLLDGMGLKVTLRRSSDLAPTGARTAMLIDLCQRTGNHTLRVGSGALGYLDAAALCTAGITVEVATYTCPPYPQNHPDPFVPALSALDLLLHTGPGARDLLTAGTITTPWAASLALAHPASADRTP